MFKIDESCALGIINVQYDFLPGGVMPVEDGLEIIEPIIKTAELFPVGQRFTARDAYSEGYELFRTLEKRCIRGTRGFELEERIAKIEVRLEWFNEGDDLIVAGNPFRDGKGAKTQFAEVLREKGFKKLVLCGLTSTVFDAALYAFDAGFEVYVLEFATRTGKINRFGKRYEPDFEKDQMERIGVKFIKSADYLLFCQRYQAEIEKI